MPDLASVKSSWVESLEFDWPSYKSSGTELKIRKDGCLFHEAHPVSHVYAVICGRIRLCQLSPTGEEKTLVVVGVNGLVGEIGATEGGIYATSAFASADSTLLALPVTVFETLFESDPAFAKHVCRNLSKKADLLIRQATALSYYSAQYRVVHHLLELALTYGVPHHLGVKIAMSFTHQEMANLVGTTRVTVAQVFSRLERNELLKKEGSCFHIPSVEALRAVLEQPKTSHSNSIK